MDGKFLKNGNFELFQPRPDRVITLKEGRIGFLFFDESKRVTGFIIPVPSLGKWRQDRKRKRIVTCFSSVNPFVGFQGFHYILGRDQTRYIYTVQSIRTERIDNNIIFPHRGIERGFTDLVLEILSQKQEFSFESSTRPKLTRSREPNDNPKFNRKYKVHNYFFRQRERKRNNYIEVVFTVWNTKSLKTGPLSKRITNYSPVNPYLPYL